MKIPFMLGFPSAGGKEGSKSNCHRSHFWLLRRVQSNWIPNHGEICEYMQWSRIGFMCQMSCTDLMSSPPVATSDCSDRCQVHACDGHLCVVHLHHSLWVGLQTAMQKSERYLQRHFLFSFGSLHFVINSIAAFLLLQVLKGRCLAVYNKVFERHSLL